MTLTPCSTCPWRRALQGTRHPAGWYKISNLRRLWNGLRTGKAPGMVCHATDPKSAEYGSQKAVPEKTEARECAGALLLIKRHLDEIGASGMLWYKLTHGQSSVSTKGLRMWANRIIFGPPLIIQTTEEESFGLPWEKESKSC